MIELISSVTYIW